MTAPPAGPNDRRAQLLAVQLSALVREQIGTADLVPGSFSLGAALVADRQAWVLLDTTVDDGTGLGAAIVWALRNGATSLDLVADAPLKVAARRAGEFALPIRVWASEQRHVQAVEPAVPAPRPPRAEHLALRSDIEDGGATMVVEHGVVTGEVRGLEVCRVVDVIDPDGVRRVRLEVGVGAHDREAFAVIHGDVPPCDALAGVVAAVEAARGSDVAGHPLNRLAPERLLRWRLEKHPELVGSVSVEPAQPPVPRRGLKQRTPCSASGRRRDGAQVVIVCSVGVDLDVIPYAADARLVAGVGAAGSPVETLVVLPGRDLLPVTTELADQLRHSVSFVGLSTD